MSAKRIVLASSFVAIYPEGGGHASFFLQHVLGLKALGHNVLWLELMTSTGNEDRDRVLIELFFSRMTAYGISHRCALLVFQKGVPMELENARLHGKTWPEIKEEILGSDFLWNYASSMRQPLLSQFKRRTYIDVDPGHVHVSALTCDMELQHHDTFFTVGLKVGDADCEVPTFGYTWHHFRPVVYLPMWSASTGPSPTAPFTSVTQWTWAELWWKNRILSISKRDAYLRYLNMPQATSRPFELAVNLDPDDQTGDPEMLRKHGWSLVHPHSIASTPADYATYIKNSRAEFCCPKPIFRQLRTGWFSDRSACYLASGRPVLTEDTGFTDSIPSGEGVIAFRNQEEAIAGVANIDSHYERHCRAARKLAEEYFSSDRTLSAMVATCCGD